jgi:3-oxoacyl-[acyl-carrier protein] reductase
VSKLLREAEDRAVELLKTHRPELDALQRAGLPHEMGSLVAFLASRRNSYMTGANVNLDDRSDFT